MHVSKCYLYLLWNFKCISKAIPLILVYLFVFFIALFVFVLRLIVHELTLELSWHADELIKWHLEWILIRKNWHCELPLRPYALFLSVGPALALHSLLALCGCRRFANYFLSLLLCVFWSFKLLYKFIKSFKLHFPLWLLCCFFFFFVGAFVFVISAVSCLCER